MKSIWTQTTKIPGRNPLPGNKKTEVAVIGAGLFGILAAHYLKEQGKEVIVLEANRIGSGQSGYTTAKITSQHNLIYQKLVNTMGEKHAAAYAMANQQAIRDYEKLIDRYRIACHFEKKDAYLFSVNEAGGGLCCPMRHTGFLCPGDRASVSCSRGGAFCRSGTISPAGVHRSALRGFNGL